MRVPQLTCGFLAGLVLFSGDSRAQGQGSPKADYEKHRPSVFSIEADRGKQPGFAIDVLPGSDYRENWKRDFRKAVMKLGVAPGGTADDELDKLIRQRSFIVTSFIRKPDLKAIRITTLSGDATTPVAVIGSDEKLGISILVTGKSMGPPLKLADYSKVDFEERPRYYALPLKEHTESYGFNIFILRTVAQGGPVLQVAYPFDRDCSGGPVLNSRGR